MPLAKCDCEPCPAPEVQRSGPNRLSNYRVNLLMAVWFGTRRGAWRPKSRTSLFRSHDIWQTVQHFRDIIDTRQFEQLDPGRELIA